MKTMQVNSSLEGPVLVEREARNPEPASGQILIRVHAAGVTPSELRWYPTTHAVSGASRINAVPGHEFSGVVAAVGDGGGGFKVGDEVYGMNDWFADGATAEYCLTAPLSIAIKPRNLTHELAATVPIGALTAWQGLFDRAKLQPGQHVLIHGGSGAVGHFAVQLAHNHGAYVVSTASGQYAETVRQLGADEVLDYRTTRFETLLEDIDVVFDTVGGETLARSWDVLAPGGRMISIAADAEGATDQRVKDAFFIVEPNQSQLVTLTTLLEERRIKTFLKASFPFERSSEAYEGKSETKTGIGKFIISVIPTPQ